MKNLVVEEWVHIPEGGTLIFRAIEARPDPDPFVYSCIVC